MIMLKYHELLNAKIAENIQTYANKIAYTLGNKEVTYTEMDQMANSIASGVIKQLTPSSIQSDKPIRIGICLPRHEHFVPCILAAIKLGCSYVPIDVATPEKRKQFICDDAQLDYLITTDNLHRASKPAALLP